MGSDPEPVVDPSGTSDYYIANQSATDLKVTYKLKYSKADSTLAIPADSTTKIYEYRTLGRSPIPPSSIFIKLSFYKRSGQDPTNSILVIEPIENDNWNREQNDHGIGAKYKLLITEEDLPGPTKNTTATETW